MECVCEMEYIIYNIKYIYICAHLHLGLTWTVGGMVGMRYGNLKSLNR